MRKKAFILCIFFYFAKAFSAPLHPDVFACQEADPSTFVEDVSVLTGEWAFPRNDIVIDGIEPIIFKCNYLSGDGTGKYSGWTFFPHKWLVLEGAKNGKAYKAKAKESNGSAFSYILDENKNIYHINISKGVANTARKEISARTNLHNQFFQRNGKFICLFASDKTKRFYELTHSFGEDLHFLLKKEELPNGNWRIYSYDIYNRIVSIRTTTPQQNATFATCHIHYLFPPKEGKDFDVIGSNNQKYCFRFSKNAGEFSFPLKTISSSSVQEECSYFTQGHSLVSQLDSRQFPEKGLIKVSYFPKYGSKDIHPGKVNTLFAPRGEKGEMLPIFHFSYVSSKQTQVLDHEGNKALYTFSPEYLPQQIQHWDKKGSLKKHIQMQWNEKGELTKKFLLNEAEKILSSCEYSYDDRGNILCETLSEDFSGTGKTCYHILREYDDEDRLVCLKEPNGKITTFEYLKNTSLITRKKIRDEKKIWMREFYFYDKNHLLTRHVIDDGMGNDYEDLRGITLRKIQDIFHRKATPFFGMIESIEEKAWNPEIQKEETLYKTSFHYNNCGNIVKKEIFDANLTFFHQWEYVYDEAGRLIKETNPLGWETKFVYDKKGDALEKQFPENRIDFIADCFNNCLEKYLPPTFAMQAGHTIETDTLKEEIQKCYTSNGQIAQIMYPDNTRETFLYNFDGTLKEHVDQEMVVTKYNYDLLGRKIAKKILSPAGELLQEEKWEYSSFHLLKEIDPAGGQTQYSYDFAGRKTKVLFPNGLAQGFFYNPLGQLVKIVEQDLVTVFLYDSLNHITEQREETLKGKLLSKMTFTYGENGKILSIIKHCNQRDIVFSKTYDELGRILSENDSFGYVKTYEYIDTGKKVLTKTPSGISIEETFNADDKLVCKRIFSKENTLVLEKHFYYTIQQKLAREKLWKFFPPQPPVKITRTWQYDPLGRVSNLEHVQGKEMHSLSFFYTRCGLLKKKLLPGNISLDYEYDFLKRITSITSSDQAISYSIRYNSLSKPIEIIDRVYHRIGTRSYDIANQLIEETQLNGLTIKNTYDKQGRRIGLTLPDQTSIQYVYGPKHLKKINRMSADGIVRYKHSILEYDLGEFPLHQCMTEDLGTLSFTVDENQYLHPKSLWLKRDFSCPLYYEDYFNILLEESLPLNNVQLSMPCETGKKTLQFDALGRLIHIQTPNKEIFFSYDIWNRCMNKTVTEKGKKHPIKSCSFLYDELAEIGMVDLLENPDPAYPYFKHLKIRSTDPINTGDGSVAYELNSRVYVPVPDAFGNVSKMLSVNLHLAKESYTYNAFGQETILNYWEDPTAISSIENPWRFKCQRMDEDCGLIFFREGYYDPSWVQFVPFSEDFSLTSCKNKFGEKPLRY